jgi:uncharacterized protein YecE (DUF72 family)
LVENVVLSCHTMQDSLFDDPNEPASASPAPKKRTGQAAAAKVRPAPADAAQQALARTLPPQLRLGTSSWFFPGWAGLIWDGEYEQSVLSKHGLEAYAQHPLLRTVSVDRSFYRAPSASQFAAYAQQVPEDFRFVVKAPGLVADALARGEDGRGMQPNPAFLDPALVAQDFVQPALDGLGAKVGALVFQLSPLPAPMLTQMPELLQRLRRMLQALPALRPAAPEGVIAVEVRNPEFLTPAFADVLREAGATYCLGLHPKMPPIAEQLPVLRALWPGPLVCRWNLNRMHGAYGYEEARQLYEPFDKLVDPDPETRGTLARVIAATTGAGHAAYVTINNKAEGSAPLSVLALAEVLGLGRQPADDQ